MWYRKGPRREWRRLTDFGVRWCRGVIRVTWQAGDLSEPAMCLALTRENAVEIIARLERVLEREPHWPASKTSPREAAESRPDGRLRGRLPGVGPCDP